MISAVPQPSAVAKITLARHTCFCGALRSATIASSRRRSARVTLTTIPALIMRAWTASADLGIVRMNQTTRNHTRLDGHGPGSMGTGSFIVRGRGNPDSFCSCSHGAGRRMSRADAKKNITLADHVAATAHVECRKDVDVIDESPAAYKDIGAVIAAQIDLIDVLHRLRGIVNVKG
jgi:hypothetical protein